jgi:ferredoxin
LLTCEACGEQFAAKQVIDGTVRSLYRRRFCLKCSPFGIHNTSRTPPGSLTPEELVEHRRRRRNAKTYRYQKKRRRTVKQRLADEVGGKCIRCGYARSIAALDFHHRDATQKEFAISSMQGSWAKLAAEAAKCDLLCANCHRVVHSELDALIETGPVVQFRRDLKLRAVEFMGGICEGCGHAGPPAIFDFHHREASTKHFGISQDGIPRRWEKVVAELAKCVMLCANCHREVHAGVRTLEPREPRVQEDALPYAA